MSQERNCILWSLKLSYWYFVYLPTHSHRSGFPFQWAALCLFVDFWPLENVMRDTTTKKARIVVLFYCNRNEARHKEIFREMILFCKQQLWVSMVRKTDFNSVVFAVLNRSAFNPKIHLRILPLGTRKADAEQESDREKERREQDNRLRIPMRSHLKPITGSEPFSIMHSY